MTTALSVCLQCMLVVPTARGDCKFCPESNVHSLAAHSAEKGVAYAIYVIIYTIICIHIYCMQYKYVYSSMYTCILNTIQFKAQLRVFSGIVV